MNKKELETTTEFAPQFDEKGLIPCITTDSASGEVLMFAFMNREALEKTIETGEAHYYSRSRQELWHKGATSGNIQRVTEMRTDCDQDCVWITAECGPACHTGKKSCFYRVVESKDKLKNQ